ncbi:hypothetical protein L208DRAFT_1312426 [Tricholoma matsutake]|nr:hypothetical protein L208DRAFT_1312426 [Tricholoma matsutake 945]
MHIPTLMGRSDWVPWSNQVAATLLAHDLISHICDMPEPNIPFDIRYVPSYPPHHDACSMPEELAVYRLWCHRDGAALSVLFGCLSPAAHLLLPNTGARISRATTARLIYNTLLHHFGGGDWTSTVDLKKTLHMTICVPSQVPEYVTTWCLGINQLESSSWAMDQREALQEFMDHLPHASQFAGIHDHVQDALRRPHGSPLPRFIEVADDVLNADKDY